MKKTTLFILIFLSFLTIFITTPKINALTESEKKVKTDIKSLPITDNYLDLTSDKLEDLKVGKVTFTKLENKKEYEIKINYKEKEYILINEIPREEKTPDYLKGYYFTKEESGKINKYLFYTYSKKDQKNSYFEKSIKDSLKMEILNPFKNKVIWNITTGKYTLNDTIEIYATTNKPEKGNWYYLDFVINRPIDRIIALDLAFEYERKYWFGQTYGKYYENYTLLYTDKFIEGKGYLPYFYNKEQAEEVLKGAKYKKMLQDTINAQGLAFNAVFKLFNIEQDLNLDTQEKPAISYINKNGERLPMVDNKAESTSFQQINKFVSNFNKNTAKTLETYKEDGKGIPQDSVLAKYAELRNRGLIGFTANDIFDNSDNKIFSVPLIKHGGNLGYKFTNFTDLKFYNLAYEKDGVITVVNNDNINLVYAPSVEKTEFEKTANKIKAFFNNIWTKYKKFLIIILCLIGFIIGVLLLLIIFNPKLINKLLKKIL